MNQDATPAVPPTYDIRATFAGPSKQVMVGAFDLRSGIRSIQIATLVVRPHDHVVRRTGSIPGLLLERTTGLEPATPVSGKAHPAAALTYEKGPASACELLLCLTAGARRCPLFTTALCTRFAPLHRLAGLSCCAASALRHDDGRDAPTTRPRMADEEPLDEDDEEGLLPSSAR